MHIDHHGKDRCGDLGDQVLLSSFLTPRALCKRHAKRPLARLVWNQSFGWSLKTLPFLFKTELEGAAKSCEMQAKITLESKHVYISDSHHSNFEPTSAKLRVQNRATLQRKASKHFHPLNNPNWCLSDPCQQYSQRLWDSSVPQRM